MSFLAGPLLSECKSVLSISFLAEAQRALLIEAAAAAAAQFEGSAASPGRGGHGGGLQRSGSAPKMLKSYSKDGFVWEYKGPMRNPSFRPKPRSRSRSRSREGDRRRQFRRSSSLSPPPSPSLGAAGEGSKGRQRSYRPKSRSRSTSREVRRNEGGRQRNRLGDDTGRIQGHRSRSGSRSAKDTWEAARREPQRRQRSLGYHSGSDMDLEEAAPLRSRPPPASHAPPSVAVPPPRPPQGPYPWGDKPAPGDHRGRSPHLEGGRDLSPYSGPRVQKGGEGSEEETDSAPSQRRHQATHPRPGPRSSSIPRSTPPVTTHAPATQPRDYGAGLFQAKDKVRGYPTGSGGGQGEGERGRETPPRLLRGGEGGSFSDTQRGALVKARDMRSDRLKVAGRGGGGGAAGGEGSAGSYELPIVALDRQGRAPSAHGRERPGHQGGSAAGVREPGSGRQWRPPSGETEPVDDETRLLSGEWLQRPGEGGPAEGGTAREGGGRDVCLGPSTVMGSRGEGDSPQSFLALSMMQVGDDGSLFPASVQYSPNLGLYRGYTWGLYGCYIHGLYICYRWG